MMKKLRCFSRTHRRSTTRRRATREEGGGEAQLPAAAEEEEEENNQMRRRSRSGRTESPTSSVTASPSASTPTIINLRREYTLAVQTNSYNEIWSKIHHNHNHNHSRDQRDGILQPDRASFEEALSSARPTKLTSLVSSYFESSEHTSHLFLSLRRSVDTAKSIYAPIAALLEVLPAPAPVQDDDFDAPAPLPPFPTLRFLSQSQCDWALETFQEFQQLDNPFPEPNTPGGCSFDAMRYCFSELKQQLDLHLRKARRRHRLLRHITRGSAACLILSALAVALAGLLLAAHALAALVAAGPAICRGDLLGRQRQQMREHMARVDTAARETYVLSNNLATIERLVARLHATVESDKVLVRLGVERARGSKGQHHPIQEVLRHLHKNQPSFLHQLNLLDEHICLCLAAVNRSRSLLLQHIHS
ncbi:Uncharacterized protein M6B38_232795 [Iris pallida]|uniref:Uncharacterized protein n=1 Tax=Iris pallida TaxID=29817 RepID=A0AAX6DRU8_IRIPA|nr:Uncharacterized protein M6B38_232795 [Iris pallida]